MTELVIVARLQAREGQEAALQQALTDAVDPTHAEDGCVVYALHASTEDPTRFVLIEGWATTEAYDAHVGKPYVADLIARLGQVALPPEVETFRPLSLGDAVKGNVGAAAG
jgi:quinol monooxygenase YgiN